MDDSSGDPFSRLVEICIEGRPFRVPEDELILTCLELLMDGPILPGRFCWKNECGNCEFTYTIPSRRESRRARGCQTAAEEGMALDELAPDLRFGLQDKLK